MIRRTTIALSTAGLLAAGAALGLAGRPTRPVPEARGRGPPRPHPPVRRTALRGWPSRRPRGQPRREPVQTC